MVVLSLLSGRLLLLTHVQQSIRHILFKFDDF